MVFRSTVFRPSISFAQLGWPEVVSSARTAIAATASFLVARLFGLPEAYWAPITTIVVLQSTLGAALKISGDRFIGTFLGAVAGGLMSRYFPQVWWMFALGEFFLGILCALLRLADTTASRASLLALSCSFHTPLQPGLSPFTGLLRCRLALSWVSPGR